MKGFEDYNPAVIFLYFFSVTLVAMLSRNPVIAALSLVGAVMLFICRRRTAGARTHLVFLLLFAVMSLINPLFYHNGVTVLFVFNNNPVTLEALIYGIFSSAMIISVLYWFSSFSNIMTSDRLLYVFGAVSPKLALILSMTLRYIPLFGVQVRKTNRAQRALGLYGEDNAIDNLRGSSRVLSVMVTWALENGIVTADSMAARGYGTGKRSRFSLYSVSRPDIMLVAFTLVLLAASLAGVITGALDFEYYPRLSPPALSALSQVAYSAYGVLAVLPVAIEIKEGVRWKYFLSRI